VTAGWVLFPTNGPSFVERFHRLVAMVVGFMILGVWASVAHQTAAQFVFTSLLFATTVACVGAGGGSEDSTS
jgi:heme A synthase